MTGSSPAWRRPWRRRIAAMDALEKGAIANPDENRMVGHYWLRAPELAPEPEITQEIRDTLAAVKAFAAEVHSGEVKPQQGRQVHPVALDRHRRLGARADVRRRRAGRPADGQDEPSLHRQHRPRRHRPRAGAAGRQARRDPGRRHQQERQHPRDPQRHARGGRRLSGSEASTSPATPSPSPASARSSTSRPGAGLARRFPMWDWVGGRTSEMSAVGLVPGLPPGARHRRHARRRGRDGRGDPHARHAEQPRRPARPDVAPRHGRQGSQGHGRPALQGPAAPLQPLPPAARHGVARQAARPRRQAGRPGHQRLRQQGVDRPARLRAAASRRREQLLRHVHPGARGRRHRDPRSSRA